MDIDEDDDDNDDNKEHNNNNNNIMAINHKNKNMHRNSNGNPSNQQNNINHNNNNNNNDNTNTINILHNINNNDNNNVNNVNNTNTNDKNAMNVNLLQDHEAKYNFNTGKWDISIKYKHDGIDDFAIYHIPAYPNKDIFYDIRTSKLISTNITTKLDSNVLDLTRQSPPIQNTSFISKLNNKQQRFQHLKLKTNKITLKQKIKSLKQERVRTGFNKPN